MTKFSPPRPRQRAIGTQHKGRFREVPSETNPVSAHEVGTPTGQPLVRVIVACDRPPGHPHDDGLAVADATLTSTVRRTPAAHVPEDMTRQRSFDRTGSSSSAPLPCCPVDGCSQSREPRSDDRSRLDRGPSCRRLDDDDAAASESATTERSSMLVGEQSTGITHHRATRRRTCSPSVAAPYVVDSP